MRFLIVAGHYLDGDSKTTICVCKVYTPADGLKILPLEVTERHALSGKALQLPALVRLAAESGQPGLRQARRCL